LADFRLGRRFDLIHSEGAIWVTGKRRRPSLGR
jgi:hypothetical protein